MRRTVLAVTLSVALLATMATALHLGFTTRGSPGDSQIGRFASYDELQHFVQANTQGTHPWIRFVFQEGGAELAFLAFSRSSMIAPTAAPDAASPVDYSATNIQVDGVDEADIVKTDGEYIYLVSANRVIIVKAYPPDEAGVLSEIEFERTPVGIFINGDRLVVLGTEMPDYDAASAGERRISYLVPYALLRTFIRVYDVSDRENPSLQREFSVEGYYTSSRMVGDYVYAVVNSPVYDEEGEVRLPVIHFGDDEEEIAAEDIYYCDVSDYSYTYTSIIAINTQDDGVVPTVETIMLGASSNLYVSPENIYLTVPVWGRSFGDFQKTSIHRIHIQDGVIEYEASGEVPGRVLNQFSMDEHDGYFRIATTTGQQGVFGWQRLVTEMSSRIAGTDPATTQPSLNHVYVLEVEDLEIVGSVEDLAPTERIFSARFMGDRAYLVTFEIIDPLFVIDLSDPENPVVLGELKITGYSDYLHPYDDDHLIGIGKETIEAARGDFSWFQGVKISFFKISDVENPEEVHKYEIGHRGTESPVLRDHRAFLFDSSRNIMVIPVLVAEVDETEYHGRVPAHAWGKPVWQGAYVFHVSPEGIVLDGRITHVDSPDELEQSRYFFSSPYSVKRSLHIGNVLYTISDARVMMNSLGEENYLERINEVELPYSTSSAGDYLRGEPGSDEPSPGEDPDDGDLPVDSPDG